MRWIPVARVVASALALFAPLPGRSEAARVVRPGDTTEIDVVTGAAVIDDSRVQVSAPRRRLKRATVARDASALSAAI